MVFAAKPCGTRTSKASLAVLVAASLVCCIIPGFNLLGYYSCLCLALLGGLVAGITSAVETSDAVAAGAPVRERFYGATFRLWPHLIVPATILLANALRVQNCDPVEGVAFYLMGPVASMVFASQVGAVITSFVRRPGVAAWLFVAVWMWSIGREVAHFYFEPQVFAYNSFGGYFAGAIYDDLISIDQRFAWFRFSNLLMIVALWGVVGLLGHGDARSPVQRLRTAPRWGWICLAVGVVGWTTFFVNRARLGVEIDRTDIRQILGGAVSGDRLNVVYDQVEIDRVEAERIHRDLRYALEQLDHALGRPHPHHIEAFIYGSWEQKRALMGAGKVDLAKPWLGEIHVTRPGSGDPVLKHELAHVVLGPYGNSLLGVPARALIFPHMGIVEGAAEALEWSGGQFTLHQWSAAMSEEGLAPPLEEIVGAGGFWRQPPGRAYTLSGSFFRWLLDTRGAGPFLRVYGDGDFQEAYGVSLAQLVVEWEAFLEGIEFTEHIRELAQRRFSAPGVFHRVCALEIAQLRDGIVDALEREDLKEAIRLQEEILSHVPQSIQVHLAYVALVARTGELESLGAAVREAESVPGLDPVASSRLREMEADGRWRGGDFRGAAELYQSIVGAPQSHTRLRNVLVKAMVSADGDMEPIIGPYLLGPSQEQEEWEPYLTDAVADLPGRYLPLYLLGRRLVGVGDSQKGLRLLRASLALLGASATQDEPMVLTMVRAEAQWLLGWSLLDTGAAEEAGEVLRILAESTPSSGRRLHLQTWADYAKWIREQTN